MQIAIDGPAGAGKSTIAKLLAKKLGFIYIDTGAMYRALALKALANGIDCDDTEAIVAMAKSSKIHFTNHKAIFHIYLDNEDVTDKIRTPEVSRYVSKLASHPLVREIMVEEQKELAKAIAVVMDGRDIGECVLPNADYKFFITASLAERTSRRILELSKLGHNIDYEELKDEIAKRDKNDENREVGALKILDDSIVIDTTGKSIEEVLAEVSGIIRE